MGNINITTVRTRTYAKEQRTMSNERCSKQTQSNPIPPSLMTSTNRITAGGSARVCVLLLGYSAGGNGFQVFCRREYASYTLGMEKQEVKTEYGFTLVEILVVVVILGILAAVVIPQFSPAATEAKTSRVASDLQVMRAQIGLYKIQHNDQLPGSIARARGPKRVRKTGLRPQRSERREEKAPAPYPFYTELRLLKDAGSAKKGLSGPGPVRYAANLQVCRPVRLAAARLRFSSWLEQHACSEAEKQEAGRLGHHIRGIV